MLRGLGMGFAGILPSCFSASSLSRTPAQGGCAPCDRRVLPWARLRLLGAPRGRTLLLLPGCGHRRLFVPLGNGNRAVTFGHCPRSHLCSRQLAPCTGCCGHIWTAKRCFRQPQGMHYPHLVPFAGMGTVFRAGFDTIPVDSSVESLNKFPGARLPV